MDCKKLQKITRIVNTPYLKSAELPKFFAALNEPFSKSHTEIAISKIFFRTLQLSQRGVSEFFESFNSNQSLVILSEKPLLTKLTVADTL